ncbi:MAG: heme ABC exporter ATP-binding protein CcmA [Pseudomonadota bacterium]|nr:heme ABC exporter ATP-binding protein CcmA [Pseudomonadota bacterium]
MTFVLKNLVALRDGMPVFNPIDLTSKQGGCIEITGVNGAGKSTLLRTLAGLHTQFEGTYEIGSVLYQGHRSGLDESLNALENIDWFAAVRGGKVGKDDLIDVLAAMGVAALARTPVGQLSQGQQRRVVMARWLLDPASVWLLDEPLTALDGEGQRTLKRIVDEACARGKTVAYATHQVIDIVGKTSLHIEPVMAR